MQRALQHSCSIYICSELCVASLRMEVAAELPPAVAPIADAALQQKLHDKLFTTSA